MFAVNTFTSAVWVQNDVGVNTGQILVGIPPIGTAEYHLLIMFLISAGTGLGRVVAVWLVSRRLFDERERLRLDPFRT